MSHRKIALLVSLSSIALACSSSSSTSNVAADGGGAATDGGSGGDAAPAVAYPAGPYGVAVGDVFPNVSWTGAHGAGATTTISSADYYDPDGSRGIRGAYFTVTVVGNGCPPCGQAATLEQAAYGAAPYDFGMRGGRFIDVLVQNWTGATQVPSTAADIAAWVGKGSLTYDVVIDPAPASDAGGLVVSIGTFTAVPTGIIVDTRTMKVTMASMGVTDSMMQLVTATPFNALLEKNGAPTVNGPGDAGTD
jgi:hypothetical protein